MIEMHQIGTLIAAWSQGRALRVRDGNEWREITPDNLKAWTGHDWVSLRDAITKYDERETTHED